MPRKDLSAGPVDLRAAPERAGAGVQPPVPLKDVPAGTTSPTLAVNGAPGVADGQGVGQRLAGSSFGFADTDLTIVWLHVELVRHGVAVRRPSAVSVDVALAVFEIV